MVSAEPPKLLLEKLANYVAKANISPNAKAEATVRDALIDTFGCILVGAQDTVAAKARASTIDCLGRHPVFGTTESRNAETAALLNATSAHALDFDDWEIPGNTHPSAVLFPALLAASGETPVSGRAIVEAYCAGFEVIARIGGAINYDHYEKGWHTTATLGAIGAAAAVARLWKLTQEQCLHAMAISVSRACGFTQQFGSDTKPLQAGFAAEAGLSCATFAKHGLTGQPNILEGSRGYIALCGHSDLDRFTAPFATLGKTLSLETHGLAVKAYPCCGYTHRIIDCAIALYENGHVDVANIANIAIHLPEFHANILPFRHPNDEAEARFSLPFCTALALMNGMVSASDFTPELWNDRTVMRLISVSEIHPFILNNPHLNYDED